MDMCGTYHTTVGFTLKKNKQTEATSCGWLCNNDQGDLLKTPTTGS